MPENCTIVQNPHTVSNLTDIKNLEHCVSNLSNKYHIALIFNKLLKYNHIKRLSKILQIYIFAQISKIIVKIVQLEHTMIHIGSIIKKRFDEQGLSASWFAKQLCCDRTNIYSIFKRESIDTTLLIKISTILKHDFFKDFSENIKDSIKE